MAKLIYYTPKLRDRKLLLKQIENDIIPYKLSFGLRFYLSILVYVPNKFLLKYYVYYVSRSYDKNNFDTF